MVHMKAIRKHGTSVAVRDVPLPRLTAADDVQIRVAVAGLCRTDIYVAEGRIACADPLVLGHEFSGTVEEIGPGVTALAAGDRVAVMPVISCGDCEQCHGGLETICQRRTMLGVDRDGAFAEFIVVPARAVRRIPAGLSCMEAAYAEPVAAALGVLNAGLPKAGRGLIYGRNRFSGLVQQALMAHGFADVAIYDPADGGSPPAANSCDFVIETMANVSALAEIIRIARPRGIVVLKSRQPVPVGIDVAAVVAKELTLRGACYGSFREGIGLLVERTIDVRGFLGPVHPLEEFEQVFAMSAANESAKFFFSPSGAYVRDC
jgi:threonine dehydrogenase-like Zn-dependent dehydrogenase